MRKSFTLLELLIVIIIIGILASVGVVNYTGTRERAMGKEAIANLKLIAAAERIYRMESSNNAYVSCSCSSANNCNNTTNGCNYLLKLSLTTQNWTYWVDGVAAAGQPPTFTAHAQRRPGSGTYSTCQYSINQAQDEPAVAVRPCP